MMLLLTARALFVAILAIAPWLSAQPPDRPNPAAQTPDLDPKLLLAKCLAAHRGGPALMPKNLYFRGDVKQRSAKGDVNEADIWQWYSRAVAKDGTVREQMVTRMRAKGTGSDSLRMFDGKRHFVVTDGLRIRVDGKASYKNDLTHIKRDLALTRFLVRHFLAGTALSRDATFSYLGRETFAASDCHKIARTTPDKVTTVYYVNADPKQDPFLRAIAFPATENEPARVHQFAYVRRFGRFQVPQEIKIVDRGDSKSDTKSVVSIWIIQLRTDEKKAPEWADITRYPRKRNPRKPK